MTFDNIVLEGFEVIEMEAQTYMIFQGPEYDDEAFMEAIHQFNEAMKGFDPKLYGYDFDLREAPTFQLEPRGERGNIEGKPVKSL